MRVIELRAENFKRLVAIDVAPKGHVVEVVGKNAQGKSSLLEAMLVALNGAGAIPSKPIRKGENKGSVRLKLGDDKPTLVVTRTFASKEDGGYTTQLTVEAADGARYAKPQQLLDDLIGAIAFDPLAFTRMKPAEQLQELRAFVPGVDFDAIDTANRADYERRTAVNRQAKQLAARLDALTIPGDPRQVRIDEAALVAELDAAGTKKGAIEKERADRLTKMRHVRELAQQAEQDRRHASDLAGEIAEVEERLQELLRRKANAEQRAADADASAKAEQAAVEALPPLDIIPDTAELVTKIQEARHHNGVIEDRERALQERKRLADELKKLEDESKAFTAAIGKRDEEKVTAIGAAKLPVDGLAFGDGEVLLNGLPFAQASSAEQLRVSVAIAAARNSKLRVIHVRDGSLLDEDGMTLLREFAEKNDLQCWVERVAGDSPVGVIIEDGRLKEASAEVAA
jgi:DNA repair exonuclease SbcCD ATPase subunit